MAQSEGGFKLIKAARFVDGNGGPPLEHGAILVEGNTIRAIGPEESVVPPEGAQVEEFNYEGQTVLPGLVDCHVHLIGMGDGRAGDELATLPDEILTLQAARNARAHLYAGVTTVRDCGAKNRTTLMLRQAMDMGITPGPRLVLSGRPLAIVGGHLSYFGIQATGEDECRAAVRQLIKEGVDFIKITATGGSTRTSFPLRPSFNPYEIRAICEEAHRFGKHAVAHCASTEGMINALDAGVDTIVHAMFKESDGTNNYRPDVAERIANQGVFVNPTFHVGYQMRSDLLDQRDSEGLSEEEQASLDSMQREHDARVDCFNRMREAGVTMVAGSDSAWNQYKMGGFQHELEDEVSAGMSAMQAIVSATSDSARSCHVDDFAGTLDEGKPADILVVDGDPTEDISALWNVTAVFQSGIKIDRGNFV